MVANGELLDHARQEKVIPSVHERKHGDIYASIHLWAWRPALFVAPPDHGKMWRYDVEPCRCISLQINLVKTWISDFCCCMQSPSNCAMLRGQRSFVGSQNESRDYRLWMLVVCSGLLTYKGFLSESCSGRSFPGLNIYAFLNCTGIILTYFRFVFPQPQNNEQTVSRRRLISKQDYTGVKALKHKMS